MTIAATGLHGNNSTVNASPYTTGSAAYVAGRLYLIAVITDDNVGTTPTCTVVGSTSAKAWTQVQSVAWDTSTAKRLSLFSAVYASNQTETLTITVTGTPAGAAWACMEITGAVITGTNGADAFVQNPTPTTGTSTTGLVTLAAFGSTNNATYACFSHKATEVSTAGSGFTTSQTQNFGNPSTGLGAEFRADNDTTADMTWATSSNWAGIAVELRMATIPAVCAAVAAVPAATITGAATATPGACAAVAVVPAPTIQGAATATPAAAAAVSTAPTPTIPMGATATPAACAAVAAVPSPTVTGAALASPSVVAAVATAPTPTVAVSISATPATCAAVAGAPAPTITTDGTATPATCAAVAAVPAPTVSGNARAGHSGNTAIAVAAVPAPTVTGTALVQPMTVEALGDALQPAVIVGGAATATPTTVDAIADVPAPTVVATSDATATPSTCGAVASVPSPTVTADAVVTPPTLAAVAAIPAPSVIVGGGATATPGTVAAIAAVPAPTILTGDQPQPSGGGHRPIVRRPFRGVGPGVAPELARRPPTSPTAPLQPEFPLRPFRLPVGVDVIARPAPARGRCGIPGVAYTADGNATPSPAMVRARISGSAHADAVMHPPVLQIGKAARLQRQLEAAQRTVDEQAQMLRVQRSRIGDLESELARAEEDTLLLAR